mmetsp:Transcript_21548/g.60176  ORF Transcript_21548/g.60176 Transcript_21548/m.60176 type:complete len:83 (-) Transcript_21548:109-357(-)
MCWRMAHLTTPSRCSRPCRVTGLAPGAITYEAIMAVCRQSRQCDRALEVLEFMGAQGEVRVVAMQGQRGLDPDLDRYGSIAI